MSSESNRLAIIIPCYNEALRLQEHKFISFTEQHKYIDIWFVNDGSKDTTLQLLQKLAATADGNIHVFDLAQNCGKAEAIRVTMIQVCSSGKYPYICFLDADLSAPLEEVLPLRKTISEKGLKIIAGARIMLIGKIIQRSAVRHYLGRLFATYYDTLLKLRNYDTQCGLKIFESNFAAQLFDQPFVSNWFFDIELFLRARKILGHDAYYKQIEEQPLNEWREVKGSKLKLTDFLKAPFEILKIYRKYK